MKVFIIILLSFSLFHRSVSISCNVNSDCRSRYSCINSNCVHDNFFPLEFNQLIVVISVFFISLVGTASGVGGGAIFSTVLMMFDNFDTNKAFPISNFIILLSSLSVYLVGASMHINVAEHKFVDYDIILIFCPLLLIGTKIGVLLSKLFPSMFLSLFLVITIYSSTMKSYNNYCKLKKIEDEKESEKNMEDLKDIVEEDKIDEDSKTNKKDETVDVCQSNENTISDNKDNIKLSNSDSLLTSRDSKKDLKNVGK